MKINPGTQSRKDKYEQLQQFMHKDLQKNLRSKDHNINLLFSLNMILSELIYHLHTTKDREFYGRKVKIRKTGKAKKQQALVNITILSHQLLKAYQINLTPFHGQAALSKSLRPKPFEQVRDN